MGNIILIAWLVGWPFFAFLAAVIDLKFFHEGTYADGSVRRLSDDDIIGATGYGLFWPLTVPFFVIACLVAAVARDIQRRRMVKR